MKGSEIANTQAALKKELTRDILLKLNKIKDNIINGRGPSGAAYLQMLMNIDDELGDVLLNWETSELDLTKYSINNDDVDEDLDDDDD